MEDDDVCWVMVMVVLVSMCDACESFRIGCCFGNSVLDFVCAAGAVVGRVHTLIIARFVGGVCASG